MNYAWEGDRTQKQMNPSRFSAVTNAGTPGMDSFIQNDPNGSCSPSPKVMGTFPVLESLLRLGGVGRGEAF